MFLYNRRFSHGLKALVTNSTLGSDMGLMLFPGAWFYLYNLGINVAFFYDDNFLGLGKFEHHSTSLAKRKPSHELGSMTSRGFFSDY